MNDTHETTPTADRLLTTEQPKKRSAGTTVAIVIGILVILALVSAAFYGLATHPPFTAVLRDIFIIVLALVTIVIGLFLAVLIFQLQSLITLLRDEIKPILESANQTASTVRGTTTFVSAALVRPMIDAASVATGVARAVKMAADLKRPPRQRERTGD